MRWTEANRRRLMLWLAATLAVTIGPLLTDLLLGWRWT
jgi:hypothetical protein